MLQTTFLFWSILICLLAIIHVLITFWNYNQDRYVYVITKCHSDDDEPYDEFVAVTSSQTEALEHVKWLLNEFAKDLSCDEVDESKPIVNLYLETDGFSVTVNRVSIGSVISPL